MKFARPLPITTGIVLGLLVIGITLVFSPPIQRWAVLRAAARQPGLKLEMARFSAGISTAEITGARFEGNGLTATVGRLEVEYSLWQILFHDRLVVGHLAIDGLKLDASRKSAEGAAARGAASPAVVPGLLSRLELPFELVLNDCRVNGVALLPANSGQPAMEAVFEIKGGNFAPDREGALILDATIRDSAAGAQVKSLHAQVSLRATETTGRRFSRINLTSVLDATGQNLSEQNQLKIVAEAAGADGGENYSVNIDTLIRGTPANLLIFDANLSSGESVYQGKWMLNARKAQLEPFILGIALPEFDSRGNGSFSFSPATGAVAMQGDLSGTLDRLEVIDPALMPIGRVQLQSQFDLDAAGGMAKVRRLKVHLANGSPILEITASQAAEIDFKAKRLHLGGVTGGEALNFKLLGVPLSWVAPFVSGAAVSGGTITGEFSVKGDSDELELETVHPLRIDQLTVVGGDEAVLSGAVITLDFGAVLNGKELRTKIAGLDLKTSRGDLLTASGSMVIPVSPNPPVTVKLAYTADCPTLLAPWLRNGHVKAAGSADLTIEGGRIEVRSLDTNLTDDKGVSLFNSTALIPFVFDPASGRATADKMPVDLLKIDLGRIPLDMLPPGQSGRSFDGTIEPTTLLVKVDGGKISLRSVTPFKLAGIGLKQEGEQMLSGLAIEAAPVFEMKEGNASSTTTGDITIRDAKGAVLMTGKGESSHSAAGGFQAALTFNLEVPLLANQPMFSGAQIVSEGRASGEIRTTLGPSNQVEGRLTVNGLVAREAAQVLPVANLSFRAVVQEDGRMSLQVPLLFDRAGQRSDLNFSLDITPSGNNFALEGKMTGEQVELSDLLSVLGVFSSDSSPTSQAPTAARPKSAGKSDSQSAWSRLSGHLFVDVKSVTSGKDWSMTGLMGDVGIDPATISLRSLKASFGGNSRLDAKAGLSFIGGASPYNLAGDFTLTEFDVGRLFKALDPTKAPTIEGLFTVNARFVGKGQTLDRTIEQTHGQFDLTSRQGIFRGLQRASGKVSMTSKAVELGASVLGSLFGSDKATKAAEKVAGQAYFVDQLAQSIGEFNYDQLSLKLVRDESLDLKLQDISLISPEVRLLGKGTVSYISGKPLMDQPMVVALSFAARGKVEQLLGKIGLLDGTRDEVDYARTKEPITLRGTLAKPDPSAYFTKVATARLSDLLDAN